MFPGRCFRYLPNARSVYALRGGPLFEGMGEVLNPDHGRIYITDPESPPEAGVLVCRCGEIWFALMPSRQVVEEIEKRDLCNAAIVDYYGDVLQLSHNPSRESIRAGRTNTDAAWEWWYRPEQQETMKRALRAAAVVTTPWPHLINRLHAYNPHVVLLPDCHANLNLHARKYGPFRFAAAWRNVVRELELWYVEKAGDPHVQ